MLDPKALVIGLGMGQQYRDWLSELGYAVFSCDIDPAKKADYQNISDAVSQHVKFDIIYIGTPNHTHELIAHNVVHHTKLLLIEKPGFVDSTAWRNLIKTNPDTRIMMIKNNQYRLEISKFKQLADASERVYVRWNNANRIPHPGSWFTTRSKSFGGVSRDLMPHMLSYYCALTNYSTGVRLFAKATQRYELKDIQDTDYGSVNHSGVYDVDDFCELEFKNGNTTWILTANWKTNLDHDDSSISFVTADGVHRHELGLCPKEAYQTMIETAMSNLNNNAFWQDQLEQDLWIHKQIEHL
jgi:predicted dehydrogenase